MAPLIEANGLQKIYNRHRPDETEALREVDLKISAGEAVVLRGPSGSGKTSLLSLLGCMARPTAGSIRIAGQEVGRLPERFLTQVRREKFGFIFQQLNLINELKVIDNLLLPLYPTGLGSKEMHRRADEVLAQLDLQEKRERPVRQLSGGQQQRVAIGRALINQPQILIADEPTAHLDSRLTAELLAIFAGLKAAGKTILIATHDPAVAEHPLVDRQLLLHDGSLRRENG